MQKLFISAIDTEAGKTIATGWLASQYLKAGISTITMKLAQTGCKDVSDDILIHRRMMGTSWLPEDESGETCPYIFPFPASPHLAARLMDQVIDPHRLSLSVNSLSDKYKILLIEGVGGIMVPLTSDYMVIDFVKEQQLHLVLVTSAKLGSINHTLLTLEVCKAREINIAGIIFNHFPANSQVITDDSKKIIYQYAQRLFPSVSWAEMPILDGENSLDDVFKLEEWLFIG